jgi:acetylornithine deacetylase
VTRRRGGKEPTDDQILVAIAAERPAMEELLVRLVEAPTLLGQEAPGQAVMRAAFEEIGLAPLEVPLDPAALRAHPGASPFSWDLAGKANVVAEWRPGKPVDGRSLILNGHIDVVSPEPAAMWSSPPFVARREGDWLYGRGAGDMKAGLAAIVGAVRGLKGLGLAPRGPVELQSVVEEECTGNGALACVLAGHGADAVIVTEPTSGAIQNSQVGVLWFQVRVAGRPAHAGDAPEGQNAIEATFPVIRALRELEAELNVDPPAPYDVYPHPINLNVGMMSGGDWPSTVAAQSVAHFRLALYPGGAVDDLKRRVEETVAAAASGDLVLAGFEVEVVYDGFACEGYTLEEDAPIVTTLGQAVERTSGTAAPVFASTATTDARSFQLYGESPALCFGPHAEGVHGVDERVLLSSMVETAQALGLFIRDWCGLTPAGA